MKRKKGLARGISFMLSMAMVLNIIVMPVSASEQNAAVQVPASEQLMEMNTEQAVNNETETVVETRIV